MTAVQKDTSSASRYQGWGGPIDGGRTYKHARRMFWSHSAVGHRTDRLSGLDPVKKRRKTCFVVVVLKISGTQILDLYVINLWPARKLYQEVSKGHTMYPIIQYIYRYIVDTSRQLMRRIK